MKGKVVSLFGENENGKDQEVKYSRLFEMFIEPFAREFSDVESSDEIFEFAMNAWNFANMEIVLPKNELDTSLHSLSLNGININLLRRMMDYKLKNFNQYTKFIIDFKLKGTKKSPILSVVTQDIEGYLADVAPGNSTDLHDEDFEEGYIDRIAITIKPLKPYWDWCRKLDEDFDGEILDVNTYLISESVEDIQRWLKVNFDKLFSRELNGWNTDNKNWPKKRSYAMFSEWFEVSISEMVYDLEPEPISKVHF